MLNKSIWFIVTPSLQQKNYRLLEKLPATQPEKSIWFIVMPCLQQKIPAVEKITCYTA